jgi:hypothetical protein
MTPDLMSSIVDGSIAALGIAAAVILLMSALVTSETPSIAEVEGPESLPRKPMKWSA